jgi:hypothetical protein
MTVFPENFKVVTGIAPQVGGAIAVTSDTISLKYAQKVWIVVNIADSNGDALLLTPQRDISVAAAASVALVNNVKIWSNASTGTTDLLTRQTDALNFQTAATAVPKMVVFEINPDALGDNGATPPVQYDCINLLTGAIAATTTISVDFYVQPRYSPGASMIVD